MITAQTNSLSGEVLWALDAALEIFVHLRLAEKTTGKDWNGMHRHALIQGDNVRRERALASVKLEILKKPLVAALFWIKLQKLKVKNRMVDGAFQKRRVPIVRSQGDCNSGFRQAWSPISLMQKLIDL